MLFFDISLTNSELQTTHNTFQDCRMHFFQQPFSKQLYIKKRECWGIFISQTPNNKNQNWLSFPTFKVLWFYPHFFSVFQQIDLFSFISEVQKMDP